MVTETKQILEIDNIIEPDVMASGIADKWVKWKADRSVWEDEARERRNFVFQTDTTKTSVGTNTPWKNSTTRPKICQIRDNLHANYMAALFPHEDWLKWLGESEEDVDKAKASKIEAYMKAKLRASNFEQTISELVYDYIDYGNCFGEVIAEAKYHKDKEGNPTKVYVGPKLVRVPVADHVFDLTARDYKSANKITRSVISIGGLEKMMQDTPDAEWIATALDHVKNLRKKAAGVQTADQIKTEGFQIDGFGHPYEYLSSGMVEVLEFEGDVYDPINMESLTNRRIIVIDRSWVVLNEPYKSWLGRSNKEHAGWRTRPDNLMAMGPLDNLVGMQYRIDHLENLAADVFDQIAHPIVYTKGYVEPWNWGPGEQIFGDTESDVNVLRPDSQALNADFKIDLLERAMEDMAGAPRQAMGIRTPGEKTAFEVGELSNAASRIFQHKINQFQEQFMEPILNQHLAVGRQNLDAVDLVQVMDNDLGVVEFLEVTKEDIQATGKLVPMGARHFARQNILNQNLFNLGNSALYQDPAVSVHMSGKQIAKLIESTLDLERFAVYRENVRIDEQLETQTLAQVAEQNVATTAGTTPEVIADGTEAPPEI